MSERRSETRSSVGHILPPGTWGELSRSLNSEADEFYDDTLAIADDINRVLGEGGRQDLVISEPPGKRIQSDEAYRLSDLLNATGVPIEEVAAALAAAVLATYDLHIPDDIVTKAAQRRLSWNSMSRRKFEPGGRVRRRTIVRMAGEAAVAAIETFPPESLQKGQSPVINEGSNEKDSVTQVENSPSTTSEQLAAIQQRGSELSYATQTVASLGLEDAATELQVAGLHEIATRCEDLARNIGLTAIAEGRMSQAQLAKLLGVAQMTVHRWRKDREEQDGQRVDQQGQ